MEALHALQKAHRISVLVIGDVMLDAYLIGQVKNRLGSVVFPHAVERE